MQSEGNSACPQAPGGRGKRWLGREAARSATRLRRSGRREMIGPQRPGHGDPAAAPSLGSRYPRAPGGRGLQPLPTLPPRPARTPRPLRCPFAGQVPDTHVSRGSSGSSPARCSPTHSRPKERSEIRVARGPAGRNTWGLRARNRKRPLAPPLGRAGASLGCGRFGRLVVGARCVIGLKPGALESPVREKSALDLCPQAQSPLPQISQLPGSGIRCLLRRGFCFHLSCWFWYLHLHERIPLLPTQLSFLTSVKNRKERA